VDVKALMIEDSVPKAVEVRDSHPNSHWFLIEVNHDRESFNDSEHRKAQGIFRMSDNVKLISHLERSLVEVPQTSTDDLSFR
jgi:hypothetical protein